ncbi:MAG TPA: malto-oligosyltrehalose synthase [Planctomycetaceae bacterium]|nr:malto-oligosyltrehalose synthase [Planctomycetaceae bacterium]
MSMPAPTESPLPPDAAVTQAHQLLEAVAQRLDRRTFPEATYRLQFHAGFTFRDAIRIIPYLSDLGISHVYASSYLRARKGSTHGYDIVDHTHFNPEIGDEADFEVFVATLRHHGMGHILDIVPNHMGVGDENAWWVDVLENGASSQYASYFDIDWMPLKPDLANRVLLPVLGDQFGRVLENQELVLHLDEGTFFITYYQRRLPVGPATWASILDYRLEELTQQLGAESPALIEYQSILTAIRHLPPHTETDPQRVAERMREKEVIKRRLAELCRSSPEVDAFLQETVRIFNGVKGEPHSFDLLDQLLQQQPYRLAYWRVAADEINYRRFFDVNDLAAITMENPEVFQRAHAFVFRLVGEGKIDGLRIDHADGLYDPREYLWRLQQTRYMQLAATEANQQLGYSEEEIADVGVSASKGESESAGEEVGDEITWPRVRSELLERHDNLRAINSSTALAQPLYVVVEKILEPGERLPANWPVNGTTGYDYLNLLNRLFVERSQVRTMEVVYSRFIHGGIDFRDLVYRCKKLVMEASMSSEISVLGHRLDRISEHNRLWRDLTLNSLTDAIREVVACFPVYRTYIVDESVHDRDRHYIETALAQARLRNPAVSSAIYDFVRDILLFRNLDATTPETQADQLHFVRKLQQITGPVMAKGVEDTAFYVYHRLDSLNEVGGDPEAFGGTVAAFHADNRERQARWPYSLLATSTHDTKRSEDVRARIDVISEFAQEWKFRVFRWSRANQRRKVKLEGELSPSRNDEYLFYQSLLGIWPWHPPEAEERQQLVERLQQYMTKAVREAKVSSSWINPNAAYEQTLSEFIAQVLDPETSAAFLDDFVPFAQRVAEAGIWNSLSQTVLKLCSPGVPDIYQGAELWDFSLVDPDNRRPVDYAKRTQLLAELDEQFGRDGPAACAQRVLADRHDGRIKLYVTSTLLRHRGAHRELCSRGAYVPLEAIGERRENLCAFARQLDGQGLVVAVPRLSVGLTEGTGIPIGPEIWGDTWLLVPTAVAGPRFRNLFTGEILAGEDRGMGVGLAAAEVFREFPVAVFEPIE